MSERKRAERITQLEFFQAANYVLEHAEVFAKLTRKEVQSELFKVIGKRITRDRLTVLYDAINKQRGEDEQLTWQPERVFRDDRPHTSDRLRMVARALLPFFEAVTRKGDVLGTARAVAIELSTLAKGYEPPEDYLTD